MRRLIHLREKLNPQIISCINSGLSFHQNLVTFTTHKLPNCLRKRESFSVNIKSDSLNFNVFVVFLLHHLLFSHFHSPIIKLVFLRCIQFQCFDSERGDWCGACGFSFSIIQVLHFPKKVIDYQCVVGIHSLNSIKVLYQRRKNPSKLFSKPHHQKL